MRRWICSFLSFKNSCCVWRKALEKHIAFDDGIVLPLDLSLFLYCCFFKYFVLTSGVAEETLRHWASSSIHLFDYFLFLYLVRFAVSLMTFPHGGFYWGTRAFFCGRKAKDVIHA
ncbi:hypothetical protein TcCL_NonESM05691 [Trypanosoma cruzi]|nr:hypothetical protein TcCL_NonESM05691 [Trypanosoma cruzi]